MCSRQQPTRSIVRGKVSHPTSRLLVKVQSLASQILMDLTKFRGTLLTVDGPHFRANRKILVLRFSTLFGTDRKTRAELNRVGSLILRKLLSQAKPKKAFRLTFELVTA